MSLYASTYAQLHLTINDFKLKIKFTIRAKFMSGIISSYLQANRGSDRGSTVVIRVKFIQTELMVEICSKILVRANGEVLLMESS